MKSLKPPQITVVNVWASIRVRRNRGFDPFGRKNPFTGPHAAIEVELRELEQVARTQAKATASHCLPCRLKLPLHSRDAERRKKILPRKIGKRPFDGALQEHAERCWSGSAILPTPAVRRIFWLVHPTREAANR